YRTCCRTGCRADGGGQAHCGGRPWSAAIHHSSAYPASGSLRLPRVWLRGAPLLLAMPGMQLVGNVSTPPAGGDQMTPFPVQAVSHARVLVVGDIMLDRYWFGEVDRISPEAPVPVVRVARREDRLGGAANVARNVAALGAH